MSDKAKTPEDIVNDRIEAAALRRAAIQSAHETAFKAQLADDLEALAEFEESLGFDRALRIDLGGWKSGEGAATMVIARTPGAKEPAYRKFEQLVSKAKADTDDGLKAGAGLADVCIVYPSKDSPLLTATLELAAGIKQMIALQIIKAVRGKAEKEKKD